jgi:hypothetical protein
MSSLSFVGRGVRLEVRGMDQKPAAPAVGLEVEPRDKSVAEEEGRTAVGPPGSLFNKVKC